MTVTKSEIVDKPLIQLKTLLREYYIELGFLFSIIAGVLTEYNCYAAGLPPFWGLFWLLPMAGLHQYYYNI